MPVAASISPLLVVIPVRSSVPTAAVTVLPLAMVTPLRTLSELPLAVADRPVTAERAAIDGRVIQIERAQVASISPLLKIVPVNSSTPTAAVTRVPNARVRPFSVLLLLGETVSSFHRACRH